MSSTPANDALYLQTFKRLAQLPIYSSCTVLPTASSTLVNVQATLSQRDYVRKIKRKVVKNIIVSLEQTGGDKTSTTETVRVVNCLPVDLGSVVLESVSKSGNFLAVLRAVKDKEDKGKKKFAEIWQKGTLRHVLDVSDNHGDFYTDDYIGSLRWSRNETKFVYVAERKLAEDDSEKYNFVPDWGERLVNKRVPVIVVVDLETEPKVNVLPVFDHVVPGQVLFGPEDKTLIFMGYKTEPRRFGIAVCNNRLTGIYQCQMDGSELASLSEPVEHARSPRLNNNGDLLVFLANQAGGAHAQCSELRGYKFSTSAHQVIVRIVQTPHNKSPTSFPGLYIDQLPWDSFARIDDSEYLIVHSFWRSRAVVLAIELASGNVINLSDKTPSREIAQGDSKILALRDNYIIMSRESPSEVNELYLGIISGIDRIKWTSIDKPNTEEVLSILSGVSWSIVQPYPDNLYLEFIYLKPKDPPKEKKLPLIVVPHGGPHSVSTTRLDSMAVTLISMGFAIAQVNYTGSTGFGQESIDLLTGKIGDLEVEETHSSAKYLIEQGEVDPERVALMGGSHGGFTSGHLIGRYPDFYKACVLRNPVLNIGGMVSSTDIPDWCYAELGIPYSLSSPPVLIPEHYSQMFSRSPIANVDRVKTPTLLTLGEGDRRVPHQDGLAWWYHLKGKGGVEIICKMYGETGHGLDSIEAEIDGANEITKFLAEKIRS